MITISGRDNLGLDVMWDRIREHRDKLTHSGELQARRARQRVSWMHAMIEERLRAGLQANAAVMAALPNLEERVAAGSLAPGLAVDEVFALMTGQDA